VVHSLYSVDLLPIGVMTKLMNHIVTNVGQNGFVNVATFRINM
jgi:hypothetical protein